MRYVHDSCRFFVVLVPRAKIEKVSTYLIACKELVNTASNAETNHRNCVIVDFAILNSAKIHKC